MSTKDTFRETAQLRHRRSELDRRREKAMERVALFPNPVNTRQIAEMRDEIDAIDRRLAELDEAS
jgi:hypothetical protein